MRIIILAVIFLAIPLLGKSDGKLPQPFGAVIEQEKVITWQEYQKKIKDYQVKIIEIKNNCDTDKRCLKIGKEKRVDFGVVTKKEIKTKLDEWIKNPNSLYAK